MKFINKYAKVTIGIVVLIGIIFSIFYYFKVVYKLEEEARLVELILPSETQNIKYAIDEVKIEKLKWKDALLIKGWVLKENVKSANRDVFMVFKGKDYTQVFKIEKDKIYRPDVSKALQLGGGINNHGFEVYIPLKLLKEKTYHLGFVIQDETGKYYTSFSSALIIADGTARLDNSQPFSDQVSVSLKVPNVKINCNFETTSVSGNKLSISGWGYLQGLNSESLKSYILLKKNEKVTVFSVNVLIRKDVTNYFKESGLNLDSTGFLVQIPVENLEKGHYQVGLYIMKGDQTGMIYSDKYIDIGK